MAKKQLATVFLSHNSADKGLVRKIASCLALTGTQIWYDEWSIRPGDSIPGEIDKAIAKFQTFVLFWSKGAKRSSWVRIEMHSALTRWLENKHLRVVPVLLDGSQLPTLFSHVRYIDGRDKDCLRISREILGIESESAFRGIVQSFIDEAELDFRWYYGAGIFVACPQCSATPDNLESFQTRDESRDDLYVGARCKLCGWSDASEV